MAQDKQTNRHAALQGNIVRAYKMFGLVALLGILVGLTCYLIVSVFYLMDRSWVRPVILDPAHPQVVETQATLTSLRHQLGEAQERRDQAALDRDMQGRQLAEIERFQKDFDATAVAVKGASYDAVMARQARHGSEIDKRRLERSRSVVALRVQTAAATVASFESLMARLETTPYALAADKAVFVAFVPYENMSSIEPGAPIYACKWGLIRCSFVGNVREALAGEVTDLHPHNGSSLRGVFVEIDLPHEWAAKETALFVGGRPLWVF